MKGNKQKTTQLLKTAKGQIEGVLKMIEDDRYCIDISNQLLAILSLIQKANKEVIKEGHVLWCEHNGHDIFRLSGGVVEHNSLLSCWVVVGGWVCV